MRRISIKLRIIFLVSVVAALYGMISIVTTINYSARQFKKTTKTELNGIEGILNVYFADIKELMEVLSNLKVIKSSNHDIATFVGKKTATGSSPMLVEAGTYQAAVYERLQIFAEKSSRIANIGLGIEHNGGYLRYPAVDRKDGYDARERKWYKQGKANPHTINSLDAYKASNGKIGIILDKGIVDETGVFKGVLNVNVDLDTLKTFISRRTEAGEGIIIVDSTGKIIVDTLNEDTLFKTVPELGIKGLEKYTATESFSKNVRIRNALYTAVAQPISTDLLQFGCIVYKPQSEYIQHIIKICILFVSVLVFAIGAAWLASKHMTSSLFSISNSLKDIAQGEGDLTVRLPVSGNDEMTDISGYFNETISKIASSIKEVSSNTDSMSAIGSELSSSMTETAAAVNQISSNIDGVKTQVVSQADSVTRTSATMERIIKTIQQLNSSITAQAESVAQSSSAIEQMAANITSITLTLDRADDTIQALASATSDGKHTVSSSTTVTQKISEESGSLLEASSVIQHIASQTNLLAMNAAIEAAHAGEAGKGFAVVADEIRKLAEESATQGRSITATLKTLSAEIESLAASSKTVEDKFNEIFTLSGQVKSMSAEIMESMREQEHGSHEVLIAIQKISTVTSDVKGVSHKMLRGGEQIAHDMHKLDELTRTITSSMNEMASGVVQINQTVQDVNEIAHKNKQSIDNLAAEVGKFKV